jgi:IS30 family transposase
MNLLYYIAIKISGRNSAGVRQAMDQLHEQYRDRFAQVFKTITVDNGPEFDTFSYAEAWGTRIYFAHPYSSWERPRNERHNGMLRDYIPKGESIEKYTHEEILSFADALNSRPRRVPGYHSQRISSIHSWTRCMLVENHYRLKLLFNLLLQFRFEISSMLSLLGISPF